VLAGKLAAEVVADRAAGKPTKGLKAIRPELANKAKQPAGVKGQGAIAFGGGAVLSKEGMKVLRENDAAQFDEGQAHESPAAKPKEDLATAA
jgi:15-cis-phytoene desaturase